MKVSRIITSIGNFARGIDKALMSTAPLDLILDRRAAVKYWKNAHQKGMRIIKPSENSVIWPKLLGGLTSSAQIEAYRSILNEKGIKRIFLSDNFDKKELNSFLKIFDEEPTSGEKITLKSYPTIEAIVVTRALFDKYSNILSRINVFTEEEYILDNYDLDSAKSPYMAKFFTVLKLAAKEKDEQRNNEIIG